MKTSTGRGIAVIGLVFMQAVALAGCVLLERVGSTSESHIVDDGGVGFNVTKSADSKRLKVSLDTEQTIEKGLLSVGTLGINQGPSASEFDRVASKWINFEHPECRVGQGRRLSFGAYEYDLTCTSAPPTK